MHQEQFLRSCPLIFNFKYKWNMRTIYTAFVRKFLLFLIFSSVPVVTIAPKSVPFLNRKNLWFYFRLPAPSSECVHINKMFFFSLYRTFIDEIFIRDCANFEKRLQHTSQSCWLFCEKNSVRSLFFLTTKFLSYLPYGPVPDKLARD